MSANQFRVPKNYIELFKAYKKTTVNRRRLEVAARNVLPKKIPTDVFDIIVNMAWGAPFKCEYEDAISERMINMLDGDFAKIGASTLFLRGVNTMFTDNSFSRSFVDYKESEYDEIREDVKFPHFDGSQTYQVALDSVQASRYHEICEGLHEIEISIYEAESFCRINASTDQTEGLLVITCLFNSPFANAVSVGLLENLGCRRIPLNEKDEPKFKIFQLGSNKKVIIEYSNAESVEFEALFEKVRNDKLYLEFGNVHPFRDDEIIYYDAYGDVEINIFGDDEEIIYYDAYGDVEINIFDDIDDE
jgi:hypothetical protein